jgi:CheY-like chemotaxis protein
MHVPALAPGLGGRGELEAYGIVQHEGRGIELHVEGAPERDADGCMIGHLAHTERLRGRGPARNTGAGKISVGRGDLPASEFHRLFQAIVRALRRRYRCPTKSSYISEKGLHPLNPLVLLVDDDDFIRSVLTEILVSESYRVVTARDGEEALGLLDGSEQLPNLILVDLVMPKMDGNAFLRKKAECARLAQIPVLVLTAGKSEVQSPDVIGLLRKPFDIEDLARLLRRAS